MKRRDKMEERSDQSARELSREVIGQHDNILKEYKKDKWVCMMNRILSRG